MPVPAQGGGSGEKQGARIEAIELEQDHLD